MEESFPFLEFLPCGLVPGSTDRIFKTGLPTPQYTFLYICFFSPMQPEPEESTDRGPEDFQAELNDLVHALQTVFKAPASRWFYEESSETLFVEIQGLETCSEDEIASLAEPVLEECELDLEEILLLPMQH